ncbi:FkbM family methyltransferase [Pelagibacteraceae bacterium]|jgi:FkbM family methyltransferase|nr:FkbM family methyltransferase [Pelagibacteraceae bacterium]
MKFKLKLRYYLFKIFPKKFVKFFNRLYEHRLHFNLLDLMNKGLEINNVFDIGAFRGEWSNLLSKTSLKDKNFYLFEANKENEKYLKKLDFKYFFEVLSDRNKEVEFYADVSTGDSYFVEQTSFYKKNIKPQIKKTITLDEIVVKKNLPFPNFIKIDTQGSELDILKGSQKSISKCSLIYLECPIIEYNLRAPNLDDYIKYLNSINFVPYDLCEIHKIDNILIQIDILFIKKSIFNNLYPGKKILNILNSN